MTTTSISARIESLVEEAKTELFIISPYLKIHRRLEQLIVEKSDRGVEVILVFGKDRDQQYIRNSPLIATSALFYCERLHAKCYMNEGESIVTSMNLYDYSQVNNIEFGIYVTSREAEFQSIRMEVIRIIRESQPINTSAESAFHRIDEIDTPLSMFDLRRELLESRNMVDEENRFHLEISRYLMSKYRFKTSEIYKDGTALLGSTRITKEQYLYAVKKFKG